MSNKADKGNKNKSLTSRNDSISHLRRLFQFERRLLRDKGFFRKEVSTCDACHELLTKSKKKVRYNLYM